MEDQSPEIGRPSRGSGMQRWQIVLIVVLPLMNLLFLLYFLRRSDFGIADSVDPAAEKVLEVSELEVEWITKQAGYDVISPKVSCSGKIQNTDSRAWQSIEVELEMYDAQDRFLGEVGTYLRAQLQPGQVENFQMVEYVPENVPIDQVARTEFRVTDGSRD